jgi:hypothetical protein
MTEEVRQVRPSDCQASVAEASTAAWHILRSAGDGVFLLESCRSVPWHHFVPLLHRDMLF